MLSIISKSLILISYFSLVNLLIRVQLCRDCQPSCPIRCFIHLFSFLDGNHRMQMASSWKMLSDIWLSMGSLGSWACLAGRTSELPSKRSDFLAFKCGLSKCPLEVKWSACYVLPESPKMQIVIQLGAGSVRCNLNMPHIHKACGQLGHCCDGCCVSHQHVKTSNTQIVANNFANYWNNKVEAKEEKV